MSERDSHQEFLNILINYPKITHNKEERKEFCNRIFLLLDKDKDTFPAKTILKRKQEEIIIDSDDFMFSIIFRKTFRARIMLNEPKKNSAVVDKTGNILINILNTVLGEKAANSEVVSIITFFYQKQSNFPIKMVGTAQIERINEIAKEKLTPTAIGFEFKRENTDFRFSIFSSKSMIQDSISAKTVFKENLPFDLLLKEQEKLNVAANIIDKLKNAEW